MVGEDTSMARATLPPRPLPPRLHDTQCRAVAETVAASPHSLGLRRWFWGEGVCLQAMMRTAGRSARIPDRVQSYLDQHAADPPVIEHVNNLLPGATAALVVERTGDNGARSLVEHCLAWYDSASGPTRSADGTLEHWPDGIWADTAYMAGSFLLHAGRVVGRPELVHEAVRQWLLHTDHLADTGTGLMAHGTHRGVSNRCWWGRANAWIALAGVDLLLWARPGAEGMADVRERLSTQLRSLAARQPEHGVWDVLVDSQVENRGILETSAAAGIGAAMIRFARITGGAPELRRAGELACRAALGYIDDGVLTRVSAGTVLQLGPFGYSVIRDDLPQPWGQGLALEACAALCGH